MIIFAIVWSEAENRYILEQAWMAISESIEICKRLLD